MIDSVRQTVLSILNKNNYGYVSPSDFNLFAKQAQLEIFESYFTGLNQAINAENARMSGTDYANVTKGINEDIDVFSVTNPLTQSANNLFLTPSTATTGDDYYLLNKVLVNGAEAEPVTHSRITLLANSNLTAPSAQYPAYTIDNPAAGQVVTIYPTATTYAPGDVVAQYVRYPFDPKWTYILLANGEPVFNQSSTDYQDFELPIEDEVNLVTKILQYAGMQIREAQVVQFANLEEQKDNQQ